MEHKPDHICLVIIPQSQRHLKALEGSLAKIWMGNVSPLHRVRISASPRLSFQNDPEIAPEKDSRIRKKDYGTILIPDFFLVPLHSLLSFRCQLWVRAIFIASCNNILCSRKLKCYQTPLFRNVSRDSCV
jgi:hypothetical protein